MRDKLIKELRNAYQIKEDNSKYKFINSIKKDNMSLIRFIILQSKYNHNNTLIKNIILIIILTLISLKSTKQDALLFVSSGIPLIVLTVMYELETSKTYKMEELESATAFSLKMLVFSRLIINGFISLMSVTLISLIVYKTKEISLLNSFTSFFLPYFISNYACMKVLRTYKDNGLKYCFGVCAIVSLMFIVLSNVPVLLSVLYQNEISILLLSFFMFISLNEARKYVLQ